ncbi:uncharacterized protein KGF55_003970 [Candida pseudojiufengensis]|uniref:uncharacterized protein n=1 Tax=Candida pseudojiufengensis TaxID=497109 RepID=UPI002224535A|nr:uncharacterized protein KGF55_003970 [Candida pseudojiufengensis]KAI5961653.1 hypothetical protein KGF55_003970 [Candida pseudojiufengensis]
MSATSTTNPGSSTTESPKIPKIESIAIIGAGPAGLASLYEFLHTSKDGSSTLTNAKNTYKENKLPSDPAFKKIVAFETKDHAGGIWAPATEKADLNVPPQDILNSEDYSNPEVIRPNRKSPKDLSNTDKDHPIDTKDDSNSKEIELINELEWKRSGVFPFLFTNIPQKFTRYSYLPDEKEYYSQQRTIYPFLTHNELTKRFTNFIKDTNLLDYIRLNSAVENVEKNEKTGKWELTIRHKPNGQNKNEWYKEEFDAVVVANGHYTVPYYPHIEGLAEFNEHFPNSILHVKSFRNVEDFKGKDVLVVGNSISTANVVQYIVPVAKSVTVSKRGEHLVFKYINEALSSDGIISKPTIDHIDPKTGEFFFKDESKGNKYDKIIFSTGYHYHFPFFTKEKDYLKLINPGNLSRVGGLYWNTFDQKDPTLGTVGITVSQLNFHTIEASAAALAGVWSGAKQLPSEIEQNQWEIETIKEKGDSLHFHYYTQHTAKDFINGVIPYAPKNRYNPLEIDGEFVYDVDEGGNYLEKLFYGLKEGKISTDDTSDPIASKSLDDILKNKEGKSSNNSGIKDEKKQANVDVETVVDGVEAITV